MPIDFPSSPTNGQVYGTYVYDSSITAWRNLNTDAGATQLATSVGLRNIVPTSIAKGASGSATVNSNGTVSFTATESVSLNGVFSSAYTSYKMILKVTGTNTTNVQINLRYRVSGTDSVAASYTWGGAYGNSIGQSGVLYGNGGTYLNIGNGTSVSNSNVLIAEYTISNAATTMHTGHVGTFGFDNGTNYYGGGASGIHRVATAYDGFTIYVLSGNMTGTVQILGYNE